MIYFSQTSHLRDRGINSHMVSHSGTGHPTQVNASRLAGTQLTYLGVMEGWVDLGGWVHTKTVYLSADSHPSK